MGNRISVCGRQPLKKANFPRLFGKKKTKPIIPPEFREFFPEGFGEEDRFKCFIPIFSSICFDKLPAYLLSLRKNASQPYRSATPHELGNTSLPTIQTPALFGSMHIAFVVIFPDGFRQILKISANGYPGQFTKLEAEALTSEALTMQLLKRETKILLPEVYAFDGSFENPINSPFILMEFVEGVPLFEIWLNNEVSHDVREKHRENILREVAYIMPEMNKFTASQGGAPAFDSHKNLTGVSASKELDLTALWDHGNSPAIFRKCGPHPDLQSYLGSLLPYKSRRVQHGFDKLFLLFLEWIPDSAGNDPNDQSFVLTHTDLNLQNILVSPEGHLKSLIDWDGVAFVPRCLGNERYPGWLLNDWNPLLYNWSSKPDPANGTCHECSNSPQELSHYRTMYEKFVLEASASFPCSSAPKTSSSSPQTPSAISSAKTVVESPITSLTQNSLIIATLKAAATLHYCSTEVVVKVYNAIVKVQTNGKIEDTDDLSIMDRRTMSYLTTLLEDEGKLKKKKEHKEETKNEDQVGNIEEDKENDVNDEDEEGNDNEDEDDASGTSYKAESEEDEDEALKKRIEWAKEGYHKLFV